MLFGVAIGALRRPQVAELLSNTETYITRTVTFINDNFGTNINADDVIESYRDPQGPVQEFIRGQQDNALRLSVTALGMLLQLFTVCCSASTSSPTAPDAPGDLRQAAPRASGAGARDLGDGGQQDRRLPLLAGLLALISAVFH